jgi:TonB-linked SusC/RagA family outer membrane protein
VSTRDNERLRIVLNDFLTYTKSYGKLKTSYFLGNTFEKLTSSGFNVGNFATGSSLLHTLGSAGGYNQLSFNRNTDHILSYIGKVDFVYNDRYGFNLTVRRDGSSKFGDNNKFGNFPSLGVYWRLSSEPFMRGLDFLTDLKIRYTWGRLGRSGGLGQYTYISQFGPGSNYMDMSGVSQRNPQLTNLRWEITENSNLAIDFDFFNGRFTGTAEVYNRLTKDLLFGLPVPSSSGLNGSVMVNLGNIRNRGIEFDFLYNVIKARKQGDFDMTLGFNIARNTNKVTSLPGGTLKFPNQFARFGSQVKQGDALGTYYGLIFKGVYATDNDAVVKDEKGNVVYNLDGVTPRKMRLDSETGDTLRGGDAIYEDFNHDGIINDQDKVLVGNANPDFFGGINLDFAYKGFTLKIFSAYQYGNDLINGMRYELESMNGSNNQAITTLKRWRKQGDVTNMPRALNGNDRNTRGSTRWIEDGSYARLSAITLAYRFPRTVAQRLKMSSLDAYITANNLVTFTNYTGADPEVGLSPYGVENPTFMGLDGGWNPRTKGYTLGINMRF